MVEWSADEPVGKIFGRSEGAMTGGAKGAPEGESVGRVITGACGTTWLTGGTGEPVCGT